MARRLIISMLNLVERPLGRPHWNDAVTRLHRPEQKQFEALVLDPDNGWSAQRLNLRYPGDDGAMENGEFVTVDVGDIDGDGRSEIVFAVTPTDAPCYVMAYRFDRGSWHAEPIYRDFESVNFIRSMALGDLDQDGCEEIVVGTRPDGDIVRLVRGPSRYVAEVVDSKQQGAEVSNIREITVGEIGNSGQLDIFAASARSNTRPKWDRTPDLKWEAVPGHIYRYRQTNGHWERTVIEDHEATTHTRAFRVGELAGARRVVSCAVGVRDAERQRIDPAPALRMHTLAPDGAVTHETIDVLEGAINCRSIAIGDIDGDGVNELVVGTRSLAFADYGKTFLYAYKHNPASSTWERTTIDTSEPLGFRSVALADLDGNGQLAVIASDDGKGLIKAYRFRSGAWQAETILSRPNFIFCTAMAMFHDA